MKTKHLIIGAVSVTAVFTVAALITSVVLNYSLSKEENLSAVVSNIQGFNANGQIIQPHVDNLRGKQPGLVVATRDLNDVFTTVTPLLNETFGADLNQNVSFTGDPEFIHNGGDDTRWTGSATQGTWNFADSGKITLTNGNNDDRADFATSSTVDLTDFSAFTGKVDFDTYSEATNNLFLQFDLAGIAVGDAISLNDFVNVGDFVEQSFVIPKSTFNFLTTVVDGFSITLERTGGAKPTMKFDDLQFEETGDPLSFVFQPEGSLKVKLVSLKIIMADNVTAESSYNAFLGVSALSNGITVTAQSEERLVFSGSFIRIIDFLTVSEAHYESSVGAADSWFSVEIPFRDHNVLLDGGLGDNISFTINDNLSALTFFRVFVTVTEDI